MKNKEDPAKLYPMKKRNPNHKIQCWILILLLLFFVIPSPSESNETPTPYQYLINRLSHDGFDSEFLNKLLMDTRAELIPRFLIPSLVSREKKELYAQFFNPASLELSKKFLRENLTILRKAENRFHAEKEIIVAILLVESRFGENIGKYRAIPTLATMALMDFPEHLQKSYLILMEKNPGLSYERVEDLARKRAEWAYYQLKCFLNIIRHEKTDPLEIYGYHAGALGMAQFIPSSYITYAQSKEGLGNWLLDKEEAIFSIGNYLNAHGWKRNLSIEKKRKVIWSYNHSDPYVETILQVAQKIKQK